MLRQSRKSLLVAAALLAGALGTSLTAGSARADGGTSFTSTGSEAGPGAGHRHGPHGGPGGHDLVHAALRLPDVTDAQKSQIHALLQTERASHDSARQAHEALAAAVAAQVDAAPGEISLDKAQLKTQLKAVADADAAVEAARGAALAGLHGVLTPAQRVELADNASAKIAQHDQKRAEWQAKNGGDAGAKDGHEAGPWGRALGLSPAQETQIRANLKAANLTPPSRDAFEAQAQQMLTDFKQTTFTAPAPVAARPSGRMVDVVQAILPVLTNAQRAELSSLLRSPPSGHSDRAGRADHPDDGN